MNAMLKALSVLEPNPRKPNEAMARRQAVFDIERHDPRGDSLLDELATAFDQQRAQILNNFEAGDDLENAAIIRRVIYSVADDIRRKHPEDEE